MVNSGDRIGYIDDWSKSIQGDNKMNLRHYVMERNRIRIIIVGLILILLSSQPILGIQSIKSCSYNSDGLGTVSYTFDKSSGVSQYDHHDMLYALQYDPSGLSGTVYYHLIGTGIVYKDSDDKPSWSTWHKYDWTYAGSTVLGSTPVDAFESNSDGNTMDFLVGTDQRFEYTYVIGALYITVSNTPFIQYHASGTTQCISKIEQYMLIDSNYTLINSTTSPFYDFIIVKGEHYRLSFDGINYDFTCDGDLNYDANACAYCTININDECSNLLHNQFTWIDDGGNIIYEGYDNPIEIQGTKVNKDDKLTVMWTTWLGALQKTCYAQFDHSINLYDPFIYWDMEVYVYDNESNPIDHANVDFNQDCVINGYPARNKYTDNSGMASFTQCENKGANLIVSKDGYKTLSASISGGWYDAYTPTYQVSVVLQPTDSDNSSTWDLINDSINDTNANETPYDIPDAGGVPYDIHLYFKNMNGDYITQINDTDDYVRCYYSVNTLDDVDMTLVFQKSFTGYYFYDVDTYNYSIDNNSYGYFNISNSYFNDSTYSYRAYIYDVSYPFNDRYAYLNVVNVTNQSETHYENLTGYCMFMNTNKNGSIDYREDITCYAMVISDNASLRTVSLELYDNSTLIDYINLTNSSFDDDIYGWYLGYTYTVNHNYSLILRGYDGSILDVDNVIAKNIVGNKLTIKVTDSFNHPLSNVYVFCEHYGSINTGWLSYGTFEGLPDGETRYKASKSGYRSGLWSTINLTSENEIVNYQLIQEKQEGSVAIVRLSDNDAKNLYYPLMYFLLTIILLGALINVIK